MDKEIIIVTKDGFKFTLKERETEITYDCEFDLIKFGNELVIPINNLSYYWIK